LEPPYVAEIVTTVGLVTGFVFTVNSAVVAAGLNVKVVVPSLLTITPLSFPNTATVVLLLKSATVAPPAGAGTLSITVPTQEPPPAKELGFSATDESTWVDRATEGGP
jgi:hypothetical protein